MVILWRRLPIPRTQIRRRGSSVCGRVLLLVVLLRSGRLRRHGLGSLQLGILDEHVVEEDAHRIEEEGWARAVVVAAEGDDVFVATAGFVGRQRQEPASVSVC